MSTQKISSCNESSLENAVFKNVWLGAMHASDFFKRLSDLEVELSADESLKLFAKTLDVWLKCFRSKSDD